MSTHVLVHVDLRPEDRRAAFNDAMAAESWFKIRDVFTSWRTAYSTDDADAARAAAEKEVRAIAKSVGVTFTGIIMAGNTPPAIFNLKTAIEELGEFLSSPRPR